MQNWQLQQAKARLSELIQSTADGPQVITVRGQPTAVVLSQIDYDRLTKNKDTFVKFLRKSPLMGLNLEFTRDKTTNRDIDL